VTSSHKIVLIYNFVQTSSSPPQAPPVGEGKYRIIMALEDFTDAIAVETVDDTASYPSYLSTNWSTITV